ncbi:MAG: hypothetical protein WCD42_02805, partial [Rhizomicrobium sp.]
MICSNNPLARRRIRKAIAALRRITTPLCLMTRLPCRLAQGWGNALLGGAGLILFWIALYLL